MQMMSILGIAANHGQCGEPDGGLVGRWPALVGRAGTMGARRVSGSFRLRGHSSRPLFPV